MDDARKDLLKPIMRNPRALDDEGLGLCNAVAWTVPDSRGTVRCDLPVGHVGDHAMGIPGGYRSWPQRQTEPLPMQ